MGIIDYYSTLYGDRLVKDPVTLKELPKEPKGFPLLEDAKDIKGLYSIEMTQKSH